MTAAAPQLALPPPSDMVPDENRPRSIEFAPSVPAGETLTGLPAWTAAWHDSGADLSAQIVAGSQGNDGSLAKCRFLAPPLPPGAGPTLVRLTATWATDAGSVIENDVLFSIRPRV